MRLKVAAEGLVLLNEVMHVVLLPVLWDRFIRPGRQQRS
jgi:hypothetical protein